MNFILALLAFSMMENVNAEDKVKDFTYLDIWNETEIDEWT